MRFGLWIEPEMVSADSDLFRAHPDWAIGVPGRPRTESRQQLVLDLGRPGGRRPPGRRPQRGPRERADLVHQVGHEPQHHRAVRPRPRARAPGRVPPSLHPRPVRALSAADRPVPGGAVRVVRERGRPVRSRDARLRAAGVDERRHRCRRAPVDPVGDLDRLPAELHGRPRLGRAEPSDRAGSRRSRHARRWRSSGCSATSSTRPRYRPRSAPRSTAQVAFYARHRETFQRGRFHRLESPFAGDRDRVSWMVVAPDGATAIVGVYRILNRPSPEVRHVRLRGLDPDCGLSRLGRARRPTTTSSSARTSASGRAPS